MIITLCGPSGSGKTTLARKLAENKDVEYIPTNAREIFRQFDVKYDDNLDPELRFEIQTAILSDFANLVLTARAKMPETTVVFDRSFHDLAAFTNLNIGKFEHLKGAVDNYQQTCTIIQNNFIDLLVSVPLQIPFIEENGRQKHDAEYLDAFQSEINLRISSGECSFNGGICKAVSLYGITDIEQRERAVKEWLK